jgi:hypothetical protein
MRTVFGQAGTSIFRIYSAGIVAYFLCRIKRIEKGTL